MANNTYSEEEIEKAIIDAGPYQAGHCVATKVLAELRKPKPVFSKGQVLIREDGYVVRYFAKLRTANLRPLTLREHGKAISDLVEAMEWQAKYGSMSSHASKALKAFNAACGGAE